jgi:carboxylesterase type B
MYGLELLFKQVDAQIKQETTEIYKFSNIRFAEPPVGDLRFAAPVYPKGSSSHVENGNVSRTCPQARGTGSIVNQLWVASIVAGNYTEFNLTEAQQLQQAYLASTPPARPDPSETEDCLFLDVYVPQGVFENSTGTNGTNSTGPGWNDYSNGTSISGVPVLIWYEPSL